MRRFAFGGLRGAPAVVVVLAGSALRSQLGPDPDPRSIDSVFARYDHTSTPGCALGVFRDGRIVYSRGYGMADLNQGIAISPKTVFYIASTSKQFAAMSTALLAELGRISLDDPIRKFVPELPAYADKITVRHLVHHTSGIRDYLGLWGQSGRAFADEIPEGVALDLIARQRALDFEPGERWSYSNSGYLLQSVIVKRVTGHSLRQFAEANIFGPLGMTSTHFHDDNREIVTRRAEGYQPKRGGGYEIVRTSFALVGDGGLYTTVEDLAKWDANFYQNRLGGRGQGLIDQMLTRGRLSNGQELDYAFGLMQRPYRGLTTVGHGGSFIGFRAQFIRFPDERLSFAVLCNDATANPEQLANRVADLYLGNRLADASRPLPSGPSVALTPAQLDRWIGRYELGPGAVAEVTRRGDTLRISAGATTARLQAVSDSVFRADGLPGEFVFQRLANGPGLLASGFGMTAPAARLIERPPPTAAELAEYAGRYVSDELDTWAVLAATGDTLWARMRWSDPRALRPLGRDVFLAQGSRVEFVRDGRGRVTGFKLSAARTLNLWFAKEPSPVKR